MASLKWPQSQLADVGTGCKQRTDRALPTTLKGEKPFLEIKKG